MHIEQVKGHLSNLHNRHMVPLGVFEIADEVLKGMHLPEVEDEFQMFLSNEESQMQPNKKQQNFRWQNNEFQSIKTIAHSPYLGDLNAIRKNVPLQTG